MGRKTVHLSVIALSVLAALFFSSCWSGRKVISGGAGAQFVDAFALAQRDCNASLSEPVFGKTVTVHYPSSMSQDTARRFLRGLTAFKQERDADFEIFRSGLRSHLGDALFIKVENRAFLRAPDLEDQWYLIPGEEPAALLWKDSNSRWHFIPERSDGKYTDDDLRVRSTVNLQVHDFTHWTLWSLRTSKAILPRWFEEGTSDFMSMQFQRWKEKKWDKNREMMARLMWNRLAVREHLFSLPDLNRTDIGRYHAMKLSNWEAELYYKGSLGLIFAMDAELGTGGLVNFYREILTKTPEGDRELIATIERKIGKPIRTIGLMPTEARDRIYSTLMERAGTECARGGFSEDELNLAALGQFPDSAEAVIPVLQSLAECPKPSVAIEGIVGLRYLGYVAPLADSVRRIRSHDDASLITALEKDGNLDIAEEFVHAGSKAERWFESERAKPTAGTIREPHDGHASASHEASRCDGPRASAPAPSP